VLDVSWVADGVLPDDAVIVARLRQRDESMFAVLIEVWSPGMLRAARTIPAGTLAPTSEDTGPTVGPHRFRGSEDPYPGHWRSGPPPWPSPEDGVIAGETSRQLANALAGLPQRQRIVVILRDVEGYTSDEVCDLLALTAANQRVLLHRGRAALRAALGSYLTAQVR
jgi:RNA polymerase sigma-70 factor (ECF subfamily)